MCVSIIYMCVLRRGGNYVKRCTFWHLLEPTKLTCHVIQVCHSCSIITKCQSCKKLTTLFSMSHLEKYYNYLSQGTKDIRHSDELAESTSMIWSSPLSFISFFLLWMCLYLQIWFKLIFKIALRLFWDKNKVAHHVILPLCHLGLSLLHRHGYNIATICISERINARLWQSKRAFAHFSTHSLTWLIGEDGAMQVGQSVQYGEDTELG